MDGSTAPFGPGRSSGLQCASFKRRRQGVGQQRLAEEETETLGPSSEQRSDEAQEALPQDVQVLLSIFVGRQGRLGLAYVDLDLPERVLCMTDVLDPDYVGVCHVRSALLAGGRQGLCIVPSRAPAQLQQALTGEGEAALCGVSVQKAADFDLEASRQRLLLVKSSTGDPPGMSSSELELRALATLDLGNEQLVRSAGGLLRFMERHRLQLGELGDPQQPLQFQGIRLFSPEHLLLVDELTLAALRVFQEDGHPSLLRGGGRSKEGASLCGLLETFVASPGGRATLRRWLRQPSRDVRLLSRRLDALEELRAPRRRELLRELHRELREVRDVGSLLRRILAAYHFDNPQDWRMLVATLSHMAAAFGLATSSGLNNTLDELHQAEELAADVSIAQDLLQSFIDCDAASPDLHIQRGVDEELDAIRAQYEAMDTHLTEAAELERQRLSGSGRVSSRLLDAIAFHYFPQLGFHVSVPNPFAEDGQDGDASAMAVLRDRAPELAKDWRYQFAGGGRLFCKCDLACHLDAEVGDIVVAARELELELLLGVSERLQRLRPRLCRAAQVLADLDVLSALALASAQFNWSRPHFSREPGTLRIRSGRHPLVEALLNGHRSFVPNSTLLGAGAAAADAASARPVAAAGDGEREDDDGSPETQTARVQVVTGANLAGKSVYLKQVGLIVLLAQVGSFVPAESATLGLCDILFSRIQSSEGSAARCSSFAFELAQVSLALSHATASSLVLLDEFGKGTHAADGVALLGATLEHFCRWDTGPKVILTTHFTEVFRFGLVSLHEPALQVCSMQVLLDESREDVTYLYQLLPGLCTGSFGVECARRAGLHEDVLARAAELLEMLLQKGSDAAAPARGHP